MSMATLSKSQFKPKVLAYLRHVEETGEALIITDHGRPAVKIISLREESDLDAVQAQWAGRVREGTVAYDAETATEPLPAEAWGDLA